MLMITVIWIKIDDKAKFNFLGTIFLYGVEMIILISLKNIMHNDFKTISDIIFCDSSSIG